MPGPEPSAADNVAHRDLTGRLLTQPVRHDANRSGDTSPARLRWPLASRPMGWLGAIVLVFGVAWSSVLTFAEQTNPAEALLNRAEEIRTADPGAFRELLAQLDQRSGELTAAQVELLRFLHIYRMSLDGQFQQAIGALKSLAATGTEPSVRFRAWAFLANNYAVTRDFAPGLEAINQALTMLPEIAETDVRHQGLLAAAILYNQAGQHELALSYAGMTLDEAASGRGRCLAGILQLEAQSALGRLPADPLAFESQILGCEAHGENLLAEFARGFQARALYNAGRAGEAADLLDARLGPVQRSAYPRLIAEIHALLAESRLELGDAVAARHHAGQVVAASEGVEFSLPLVTAFRVLSREAEQRGDLAAALAHQRRFAEVDRAYLDDIKARELAFQLAQHDTLQKTHTIELLNQRNELLRLESEVNKQAVMNNRLAIALLVILLASIGLWAYLTKREQMRFRRMAQTDALTGTSNRLHFSECAPAMLAEGAQRGLPAAMVMFDLDAFKAINDRHGHAAGDWVLVEVVRVCRAACASDDLFARLGGEEFAILRIGADADAGRELADRCRRAIAAIDTTPSGARFTVSASFGVAVAGADGRSGVDSLLVQADVALYCAKSAGRNRVSVYGAADSPAPVQPDRTSLPASA